jgi:hypothetical protein
MHGEAFLIGTALGKDERHKGLSAKARIKKVHELLLVHQTVVFLYLQLFVGAWSVPVGLWSH